MCWCLLADTVTLAEEVFFPFLQVRVCLWQVVNYTNVFVCLYMFSHIRSDHRPDRQVLISCRGCWWCVLTINCGADRVPCLRAGRHAGTDAGSAHPSCRVFICWMCLHKCVEVQMEKMSVSFLLVSLWICQ